MEPEMPLTMTRGDLIRFLRHNYGDAMGTVTDERIHRAVENGLRRLPEMRKWEYLHDTAHVVTRAPFEGLEVADFPESDEVEFASDGSTEGDASLAALGQTVDGFVSLDGDVPAYRVIEAVDATTLKLERTYTGDAEVGAAARIMFPLIDLPPRFWADVSLWDVDSTRPAISIHPPAAWWLHMRLTSTGDTLRYAVVYARNDPNVKQLLLYPAPSDRRSLELVYARYAGWFAGSDPRTATWKLRATLDTDFVDWPDNMRHLLEASVAASLYEEVGDQHKAGVLMARLFSMVEATKAADKSAGRVRRLSDGGEGRAGYQFRLPERPL
jgi:hypothetical protein